MMDDRVIQGECDLKSDRLNDEVALFIGCTLKETLAVITMSLVLSLLIGVPLMMMLSFQWTLGLAVSLIVFVPIFFILLTQLSRLKQGKPAGYYRQYLRIKISRFGLMDNPYLMRSGVWSTQRLIK